MSLFNIISKTIPLCIISPWLGLMVHPLAGKYGFLDESGVLRVVEYSSNNSTGFTTNLTSEQVRVGC